MAILYKSKIFCRLHHRPHLMLQAQWPIKIWSHYANIRKLPWLPITQRIDYKLCLLTYEALQIQQPTYLYNSLSFPSHSLPTPQDHLIHQFCPSHTSEHLWVKGCFLWLLLNSPTSPPNTRNSLPLSTFCSKHIFSFQISFSSWILSIKLHWRPVSPSIEFKIATLSNS